ncbi:LptF/LptG family permease [Parasediminibacterium sp. JCM 36343]|uniref:LptF/LptG family permease n=1 Tax=Parasediminibacterium sp. JCM 36343 TaxID=3374279 RepID=UPI00397DBD5D
MIKKLDILIIRAFVGPFIATFLIAMFVLVMQFFWLYIDDLVGKGLELSIILQLIVFVAANVIPLALPIALLLSSIMTFGNLGETFEIVAIKSAGIPLLRFMQPLLIVTLFISGIAFLFSNNIIPVAQLKLATIKYNIIVSKPSFDIKEGVFYDKIEGYVIKLGKKDKDDSTIHDIVIYEKNYNLQDNILIAEKGIMRVTPDKQFLEFILNNGVRYTERGTRMTTNTEYIRLGFKTYKKVFDLKSFSMNSTTDSAFRYDPKMLSIRQLNTTIDSLQQGDTLYQKRSVIEVNPYLPFSRFADTGWVKTKPAVVATKSFLADIPDSIKQLVLESSISNISNVKNSISIIADDYERKRKNENAHLIEWHRKFTLPVACVVLFLIGAPLGAIIRKGGLGAPLVFAIGFFVIFHLLNTFGEKLAHENVTSVFTGMWISTMVLVPIGVFLTYKAMRDSQLFNQEAYYRFFSNVKKFVDNLHF